MKNLNKITYLEIKNYLLNNDLRPISKIPDEELFESLNSISKSNEHDLTFFTKKYSEKKIKLTKAKACFIDEKNSKFLPEKTYPILVDDPYKSFAVISNLFNKNIISNGIISKKSEINMKTKVD